MKNLNKFIKQHKTAILLTIILLFGLFLRIYALGTPPFWVDESISTSASLSILEKGFPISDGDMNHKTYFLHYSMALFLSIAQTEFFARIVSVIFGLLTIFLAFKVGEEYSNSTGLISALFFTVFYLEVFFSRQSRYYQLLQLAFFASLYFLYKSKEKPKYYLPLSILAFFIALDTQLQALVLAPFIILHILYFNKKHWLYSIFPIVPLATRFLKLFNLTPGTEQIRETAVNYASRYFSYTSNMLYLLILFIPGTILGFMKNKRLTLTFLLSSIITLIGIFALKTFAFRYAYFFVFPLLLFTAVLFGYLYDKYGKTIFIPLFLLILIPSNLFFPHTYINVFTPINYHFNDPSAPYTDYKILPEELKQEMIGSKLISYFASDVEFYIKKPDFVVPFGLNGLTPDQVSINNSQGQLVDRYSGALILQDIPEKPYFLTADRFSTSKLFPNQRQFLNQLTNNCTKAYSNHDLEIFKC
jgi:hypothetical protein